jgi:hypothetical protein
MLEAVEVAHLKMHQALLAVRVAEERVVEIQALVQVEMELQT